MRKKGFNECRYDRISLRYAGQSGRLFEVVAPETIEKTCCWQIRTWKCWRSWKPLAHRMAQRFRRRMITSVFENNFQDGSSVSSQLTINSKEWQILSGVWRLSNTNWTSFCAVSWLRTKDRTTTIHRSPSRTGNSWFHCSNL